MDPLELAEAHMDEWRRADAQADEALAAMKDCMNCGYCQSCIDRSIAAAEEGEAMKPREPHPMLNRLLRIAEVMDDTGFGVGDEVDGPFVREVAYELEYLKRLNVSSTQMFETVIKVCDSRQEVLDESKKLLTLMDSVEIDARLGDETDRVFPRYEFDGLRAAINKAEGK